MDARSENWVTRPPHDPAEFERLGVWYCHSLWATGTGDSAAEARLDWKQKFAVHCAEVESINRTAKALTGPWSNPS
jgi:hypothetical protein